ncbi:hypothetical protein CVT24_004162 [Panaeolus cyanescens]|uniref:Uncharacterized protein n=1 Tax=Panaeolus cyanescens TaxID=181874 RepID=A0A409W7X6_9AGAR|nr:hypothetical protein CVT24_004162 [Panaeolus cyanescens]
MTFSPSLPCRFPIDVIPSRITLTNPLLSLSLGLPTRTPPAPSSTGAGLAPSHPHSIPRIPSIRLIAATPSASGLSSSDASSSVTSFSKALEDSWEASAAAAKGSVPPVPTLLKKASSIAPKAKESVNGNGTGTGRMMRDEDTPKRRLVPKKSKLALGISAPSFALRDRSQDFSDVIRRVGVSGVGGGGGGGGAKGMGKGMGMGKSGSASLKGGFEIYVDPTVDDEIGEIVMVKKKKSRAGLDGMRWGVNANNNMNNSGGSVGRSAGGVLGEVTNVPKARDVDGIENVPKKEKEGLLKVKDDAKEKEKWWSIGRGRKDSKDEKERKKSMKPVEFIYEPPVPPRSRTPDLLSFTRPKLSKGPSSISPSTSTSATDSISRGRFNSLDSSILLGFGKSQDKAKDRKMSTPVLSPVTHDLEAVARSATPMMVFSDERAGSPAPMLGPTQVHGGERSNTPIPRSASPMPTPIARSTLPIPRVNSPVEHVSISQYPFAGMRSASATPSSTLNGLLAPPPSSLLTVPGQTGGNGKEKEGAQGSIALRAIRSVKSLARIGNWQGMEDDERGSGKEKKKGKKSKKEGEKTREEVREGEVGGEGGDGVKDGSGTVRVKKAKSGKSKSKGSKKDKEGGGEEESASLKGTIKRKVKKSLSKKDLRSLLPTSNNAEESRNSTSSFEIGHLTASPSPVKHRSVSGKVKEHDGSHGGSGNGSGEGKASTLGVKKRSILGLSVTMGGLGLGLPSTMRLQSMRSGSTASSICGGGATGAAAAAGNGGDKVPALVPEPNRLSVDSALALGVNQNGTRGRSGSVLSNASSGSSLRPVSTHSSASGCSSRQSCQSGGISSGGGSIYSTISGMLRRDSNASAMSGVGSAMSGVGSAMSGGGGSGGKARNSGASVRWSAEVLERERKEERRTSRESKHSVEGRRRGAIVSLFPELGEGEGEGEEVKVEAEAEVEVKDEVGVEGDVNENEKRNSASSDRSVSQPSTRSSMSSAFARRAGYPILTIEEATCDGHGYVSDSSAHAENSKEEWRRLAAAKLEKEREEARMVIGARETGRVTMMRLGMEGRMSGSSVEDGAMSEGDGDGEVEAEAEAATPVKKPRARPMSEQLLGKMRPKGMHEDEEGVLSILDAATNDLALLINNLDLCATPSTPGDLTPYKPSAPPSPLSSLERKRIEAKISMEFNSANGTFNTSQNTYTCSSNRTSGVPSPLANSKTLRGSMGSVSSLRPYAQSRGGATRSTTTPLLSHMGSLTGLNSGLERAESIASLRGKLRPAASRGDLKPAASITSLKPKASANFAAEAETVRLRPKKAAPALSSASNANDAAALIARPIKPWSDLLQTISPQKSSSSSSRSKSPTPVASSRPISPPSSASSTTGTFKPGHKRTMTPAPEPEPAPVFQPLRPATRPRKALPFGLQPSLMEKDASGSSAGEQSGEEDAFGQVITSPGFGVGLGSISKASVRSAVSAMSHVSRGSKGSTKSRASKESKGSVDEFGLNFANGGGGSLTPVFKRIFEDEQDRIEKERERKASVGASSFLSVEGASGRMEKRASTQSYMSISELTSRSVIINSASTISAPDATFGSSGLSGSTSSSHPTEFEISLPLNTSARRALGMSGTLGGGSNGSVYHSDGPVELNEDDEDSDVPEELKFILRGERREKVRASMAETVDFEKEEELDDHTDSNELEIGRREIDALTSGLSSPPPDLLLPNFRFTLNASPSHEIDLCSSPASSITDEDTKKSFDFTGELKKLNESGASDRRSFVEQLENAFRTPAKVDLRCGFGGDMSLEIPPVPALPLALKRLSESMRSGSGGSTTEASESFDEGLSLEESVESEAVRVAVVKRPSVEEVTQSIVLMNAEHGDEEKLVDVLQPSLMNKTSFMKTTSVEEKDSLAQSQSQSASQSQFDMFPSSTSQLLNAPEPTFDSIMDSDEHTGQIIVSDNSSDKARLSPGELNTSFKFGGLPPSLSGSTSSASSKNKEKDAEMDTMQLTLSDIIPPPAHARRLSEYSNSMDEEDSILKSIYAQIMAVPKPQHVLSKATESHPPSSFFGNAASNEEDVDMDSEYKRQSICKAVSRPASGISFAGFDSFDEVRRGFEFSGPRPTFYPPPLPTAAANRSIGTGGATRRVPHNRHESVFSIASVSSYGHCINSGSADPFEYGIPMPSLRERPSSEDMSSISMSITVDDTFAFLAGRPRRRVESDASTFSFHAPAAPVSSSFTRGHRRRESNMSVSSQAPPISLYNRSFGRHHHSRNDSSNSMSSFSFVRPSNVPGFRRQHGRDMSVDSIMSDFSGMHLGRPGVGEKMFDMGNDFLNAPLSAISASPENSFSASVSSNPGLNSHSNDDADTSEFNLDSQSQSHLQANRTSFEYDSLIDGTRDASSGLPEDSLFDKTGYNPRISMDGDSVFGHDEYSRRLYAPRQFRPLSMLSVNSVHSPVKEDDTLISMLGGGHVRRRSVGSIVDASPCARVEKRKHSTMLGAHLYKGYPTVEESPAKARIVESPHHVVPRIVEKPSIASTSSFHFGGDRMIDARHGLLERRSLEDSALVAEGEDISGFHAAPVFTRPAPKGRSRSSTCTTSSSGGDTPPLSASDGDGSSVSGGSQSSIDLGALNAMLANATHPVGPFSRPRARARARGAGHRRRYSNARMSRASVYETIEEEFVSSPSSSNRSSMISTSDASARSSLLQDCDVINETEKWKEGSPTTRLNGSAIYVVDSDTVSINSRPEESIWDDERGIVTLRKFYALKDEAKETVTESKRVWVDTPFSLYAIQSFQPPNNPALMQAMLEHSVQNYGPLPSELRPHRVRSRTSSRASPYPQARVSKSKSMEKNATVSPPPAPVPAPPMPATRPLATRPLNILKDRTVNANLPSANDSFHTIKGNKSSTASNAPSLDALKPFSPLVMDLDTQREKVFGASARPRVPSTTRRNALGWTKRSNGPTNGSKSSNGPKSSTGPKTSTGPGKENVIGTGLVATPGDNLRLNRPRPKTRATPASNARTIRI